MKTAAILLTLFLLAGAASIGGWAYRYRYGATARGTGRAGVTRTNRFTGRSELRWIGLGWRPAKTPVEVIERERGRLRRRAMRPELREALEATRKPARRPASLTTVPLPKQWKQRGRHR